MIKRDTRWEIFYGDISIEEFVEKKIPKPVFKNKVHRDIKDQFGIVHKLLIHSYYEYLFLDVAVTKALHVMEMALCIRYKELNEGKDWDLKEKPLNQLMNWFHNNGHFEIKNQKLLNYIRQVRNHMTHPKGHHFAGTVGLPWIHTIIDLINGLYEDVETRKNRWQSTGDWGAKLESFLDNGGKLVYLNQVYYVYDMGPMKIENRLDPVLCYFSLLPLFDPRDVAPKIPLVFEYPFNFLKIEDSKIDFSLGTSKIYLTNALGREEFEMIAAFKAKLNSDKEYQAYSSMLIFEAMNALSEAIRKKMNEVYLDNQESK